MRPGVSGPRDGGVATVWAAAAVAVVLVALLVGLDLGAAVAARHRAEAAADLAALAAAADSVHGQGPACGHAGRVVIQMGARLGSCRLSGWDALVEVEIDGSSRLLGTVEAVGRARAGPAAGGRRPHSRHTSRSKQPADRS